MVESGAPVTLPATTTSSPAIGRFGTRSVARTLPAGTAAATVTGQSAPAQHTTKALSESPLLILRKERAELTATGYHGRAKAHKLNPRSRGRDYALSSTARSDSDQSLGLVVYSSAAVSVERPAGFRT